MIEEDDSPTGENRDEEHILIVPIRTPGDQNLGDMVLTESQNIQAILSGSDDTGSSSSEDLTNKMIGDSTLSLFGVSDDPEETVQFLMNASGLEDEESLSYAAKCGAFWKSLGAETLIYMASYGGGLLANGLIIRFTGLNPLVGTLLFGSYAALSYENARILFTSLIKPPQDTVPEDKQTLFNALNQYAFLPISWIVSSAVSGGVLSLLGDESFGTQQAVGVPSALAIGPIGSGLAMLTRECMGGSIVVNPEGAFYAGPYEAFPTAYSPNPNPFDDNRSHRFGTLRNVFNRFLAVNLSTIALVAYGGTELATFCIGGREDFINATQGNNVTDVNEFLNDYCAGGSLTFLFRELGISLTYGIGVLVVEPILTGLFNTVYDFFYPRDEESSDDIEQFESFSSDDTSYDEV